MLICTSLYDLSQVVPVTQEFDNTGSLSVADAVESLGSPKPRTWLKELRVNRGLSQKQLSQMVGLSSDVAVLYWESGQSRPPYDKMLKLSDIFGSEVLEHFANEVRAKNSRATDLSQVPVETRSVMEFVGARIRQARRESHWTLETLSNHLGVTKSSIALWETGKNRIEIDRLPKLASALNKPLGWFFQEGA
jgi:transcriptional regulator with XRE-family HTH domain